MKCANPGCDHDIDIRQLDQNLGYCSESCHRANWQRIVGGNQAPSFEEHLALERSLVAEMSKRRGQ